MYDIIKQIIDHVYQSNSGSEQQYIYYISGALILLFSAIFIDLIYRIFRHLWR